MSDLSSVQAFMFRSATTNARVADMVDRGELRGGGAAISGGASDVRLEPFSFSIRSEAQRMARTYELLFCFENSVRELIEERLKEAYSVETWWTEGVPGDIRKGAERLEDKEAQVPWHGPRGGSRLAFVDFPILSRIITEAFEHFEDLLGRPSWVESVFDEMNQSRRAIAHTGVLDEYDVERMELRVRDWLRAVG
jgi:Swt1-like HEPN